jgi:hypothetical protein
LAAKPGSCTFLRCAAWPPATPFIVPSLQSCTGKCR